MEGLILLDTSVLIEFFRKKNKESTFFYSLSSLNSRIGISTITHFEILNGSNELQSDYWNNLFADLLILPYQSSINTTAVSINKSLKRKRKAIEFKDLLIASTALHYGYFLATHNTKHFDMIDGLKIISPQSFEE